MTVEIRPPLVARVVAGLVAVAGVVLVFAPGLLDAARSGEWGPVLPLGAFMVVWLAVIARTAGMVVRSTPDGRLVVRNQLRTTTYDRAQIEDVRRSTSGSLSPTQGALQLLLRDGTVQTLQVTAVGPFGLGRARAAEQQQVLRRWLAGP
ncbi:hypothetical protein ACI79D_00435 [Geodermatophilus sp. SYSU D00708]